MCPRFSLVVSGKKYRIIELLPLLLHIFRSGIRVDTVLQQLVKLVEKGSVEQRCAALLVSGALRLQNAAIIKIVGAVFEQSNPVLKDYALRYLEEVEPKAGISLLPRFLDDPDREMQERAVRLLGRAGQAVVPMLVQRMSAAPRAWQLNAARVLCAARGKAALRALLHLLLAGTDEFNKSVCDLMTPAMREMNAKEQDLLYDEVEAFASSLDSSRQRPAAVAAIRLLGQLGRPQARRWLFRFIASENHASLRSHALVALLRCLRDQEL